MPPSDATNAEDLMILARSSSSDAYEELLHAKAIDPLKQNVPHRYPESIIGVGKCGLRALFMTCVVRKKIKKIRLRPNVFIMKQKYIKHNTMPKTVAKCIF